MVRTTSFPAKETFHDTHVQGLKANAGRKLRHSAPEIF